MSNLWRKRVPTDDALRRLNICGPSVCYCCWAEEETSNHLFVTGPRATSVWNFFQTSLGLMDLFTSLNVRCLSWWNQRCKHPIQRYTIQIVPLIICWSLWKARNSGKFNSSYASNSSIIVSISELVILCVQNQFPKLNFNTTNWIAFLKSTSTFKWKITALQIHWNTSSTGYILNTDGSSTHNGLNAAGGGILREAGGKMIFAYSTFFGQGTNMCAEALALLVGITLCDQIQIHKVEVRCDSKTLTNMINGKVDAPWSIRPIIVKISKYKNRISAINHCYREGNTVADALAKEAQNHRMQKILVKESQLSAHIRALLCMDSMNICNFRFSKSLS